MRKRRRGSFARGSDDVRSDQLNVNSGAGSGRCAQENRDEADNDGVVPEDSHEDPEEFEDADRGQRGSTRNGRTLTASITLDLSRLGTR
jgi:hypothetical protein